MKNLIAALFFLICVTAHAANPSMAQLNFASNSLVAQISAAQLLTNNQNGRINLSGPFVGSYPIQTNRVSFQMQRSGNISYMEAFNVANWSTNTDADGWLYYNDASIGAYIESTAGSGTNFGNGANIGAYLYAGSRVLANCAGVAFAEGVRNGCTNLGFAAIASTGNFGDGATNQTVGFYAETTLTGYGDDPFLERSVMLIDNRDSNLPLLLVRTNNGTFKAFEIDGTKTTNATPFDAAAVVTAYSGLASLSSLATNAVTPTGVTNTASVNRQVRVTATAVSFTVNDASGAVLDTTPTLTATLVYTLQPGWSIRAASGLVGTILPW